MFYIFTCNSYVVVRIEKKCDKKYIRAIFVCILMVPAAHFKGCFCAVHRDTTYAYVPVCTLSVFTYIHGLRTSTYIYNPVYIYVCLRVTTSVYERSRTTVRLRSYTCQYVLICKYVGPCTTMQYYVLRAYPYLLGSFFIYTYSIRISLPI